MQAFWKLFRDMFARARSLACVWCACVRACVRSCVCAFVRACVHWCAWVSVLVQLTLKCV